MGSSRRRSCASRTAISHASRDRDSRSRRPCRAAGPRPANTSGEWCRKSGSRPIPGRRIGGPFAPFQPLPARSSLRPAPCPMFRGPWPKPAHRRSSRPSGHLRRLPRQSRTPAATRLETAGPFSGCPPRTPSASAGRGPSPASSAASPRASALPRRRSSSHQPCAQHRRPSTQWGGLKLRKTIFALTWP